MIKVKFNICVLLILLGVQVWAQNLFVNGGFEEGFNSAYSIFAKSESDATFVISSEASEGDSALQINIKSVPVGGPQVIGIYQNVKSLELDKIYTFRFALKGPADQNVRARIQGDSKQIKWFTVKDGFNYYSWEIDPIKTSSNEVHKFGLEFGDLPENEAGGRWITDDWSLTAEDRPVPIMVAYVSPDGDDKNDGSKLHPFKTLGYAIRSLDGDTIYLLEGTYHEEIKINGFKGSETNLKVITSSPGHSVKFDGTISVDGSWSLYKENIYKTTLEQDVWQLFENSQMLNAARWPNVNGFIEDEQPHAPDPLSKSLWDQKGTWGHSTENSTEGKMIDDGAMNLQGYNVDLDSAIAILNIGSFRTSSAVVTNHTPGNNFFEYNMNDVKVHWEKPDKAYYYLEGKLELLDKPGEWFYDANTKELYVWTKTGVKPEAGSIRGKVQSYALNLDECSYVKISNINFWGTTLRGDNCSNITIEGCNFNYPSYSKRMLRKQEKAAVTEFFGNCEGLKFLNNVFQYTEGEGLHLKGSDHLIQNNLFKHIDFSCVNLYNLGGTVNFIGDNNFFLHNTIFIAGSSETVTPGSYNVIEGNDISGIGHLQNDGSMVQYMTGAAIGSVTRYNWFHDSKKSGMRYDGSLDIGNTGTAGVWDPWGLQTKGQVYKNTIWNVSTGLMIKGDYHVIVNNTTFDNASVGISMINPSPTGANPHSVCKNNLSSMISGYRGGQTPDKYPIPGDHSHNWNGFYQAIKTEEVMQDVLNRDFRPKKNTGLINTGTENFKTDLIPEHAAFDTLYDIGAYEYGDTLYNIPGRRLKKTSHPIPLNLQTTNSDDVILAWRPAYKADQYNVYVDKSADKVRSANLSSSIFKGNYCGNVYVPEEMNQGDEIYWRVDAVMGNGDIIKGDVWTFTVGVDANVKSSVAIETMQGNKINFYPVPTSGIIYVGGQFKRSINYKVIGADGIQYLNGILLKQGGAINLSHLPRGMYFIITDGEESNVQKIIKQ